MRRTKTPEGDGYHTVPTTTVDLALVALLVMGCSGGSKQANPVDSLPSEGRRPGGTSAGCVQTRGQRPDTTIAIGDTTQRSEWSRAYLRGTEYRCVVNPSLPALRVVVLGDSAVGLDSIAFIPDTAGAAAMQTITLDPEFDTPPPSATDALQMIDIDADGYADLLIGKSWGATGNTDYAVWMFEPGTRRFVVDTSLRTAPFANVVPGRPCIWTAWNWSAFDDSAAMFCRRGGRWIVDSTVEHSYDRKKRQHVETFEARRHDSLVVVKQRVTPDTT